MTISYMLYKLWQALAVPLFLGVLGLVIFDGEIPKRTRAPEKSSVVLIDTEVSQGTGVLIHRRNAHERIFVWTANHVIQNKTNIVVKQYFHFEGHRAGEMAFPAKLVKSYPMVDAALLLVDAPPSMFDFSEWSAQVPAVGESVTHIGNIFGANFDQSYVPGVVSQIGVHPPEIADWPWLNVDMLIAGVQSGCSGGPVFQHGKVIGLVVGKGPPGSVMGFYVPEREIERFADRWMLFGDRCPPDSQLVPNSALQKLVSAATIL